MISEKAILLDSCILNYALSKQKDLAEKTGRFLDDLILANNKLYISQFSHYEILKGIDDAKRPQVPFWNRFKSAERRQYYRVQILHTVKPKGGGCQPGDNLSPT